MSQNPYNNMTGPRGPLMGGPGSGSQSGPMGTGTGSMGSMGPGGMGPMGGGPMSMGGGGPGGLSGGPGAMSGGPGSKSGSLGSMGPGGPGSIPSGPGGIPSGPGSLPGGPGGLPGGPGTMGRMPMGMHGMGGYGSMPMGPGPVGGMSMGSGPRMMGSGMGMPPGQFGSMGGMMRPGMIGSRMPVSTSGGMLSMPAAQPTTSSATIDTQGSTDGGGQGGDVGSQSQQQKEVNTSTICRIGQETVEEIVARTLEVFSILKSLQPPVGQYNQQTQQNDRAILDKQKRLEEVLKGIGMLFKRLRVCWDKCQESTASIEHPPLHTLIPVKDESDNGRSEIEKKRGENYKSALEEHNELIQQIVLKNRHLKDIIDQMRNTIWEINTMLAMRTL